MQLLLLFVAFAVFTGTRSVRRERPPRAWVLVTVTLVVAIGYMSQRVI